jgi:hypothetical protein
VATDTKISTLKRYAGAWFMVLVVGFALGKISTWDSIITDCKVLGMTRYWNVPIGCRVGEAYK